MLGAEPVSLTLNDRLKIPDRFTVIPAGPGQYRLHSLGYSLAIGSPSDVMVGDLLPLLDGTRTLGEILLALKSFDAETVRGSIERLFGADALERVSAAEPDPLPPEDARRFAAQIAFFSNFVAPPGGAGEIVGAGVPKSGLAYQQRLTRAHVAVFGVGRLGSQLIRSLAMSGIGTITAVDPESVAEEEINGESWFELGQTGLNRAEAAGMLCSRANPNVKFNAGTQDRGIQELLSACSLAVLCPDHFNPAQYEEFNLAALASKTTWISARLSGYELLIGPTVIPGETACFQCLEARIRSNVPDHAEYTVLQEFLTNGRLRPEMLSITPGAGLLALEVVKAITWFMPPATYSHLFSLSLLTLQSKLHPVLKVPRCSACGRPATPRPSIHAWQQSKADQIG